MRVLVDRMAREASDATIKGRRIEMIQHRCDVLFSSLRSCLCECCVCDQVAVHIHLWCGVISLYPLLHLIIDVTAPASLTDVSALEVVTTITNTGDETVTLLNDPRTVLSSWATQSFIITGESGVEADFTGVAVRYIPEVVAQKAEKSVTILAAGESVDVTHEGIYGSCTLSTC